MFQVLHSSAGAGKTHALVKHYIGLALHEAAPDGYTRILALTFTNKAAAEMRERILDYLEGLATGAELNAALLDVQQDVMRSTSVNAAEVERRAGITLTHMLHHWPQLAVTTIDAFTRRVVMPFARDLRLDSDLRMTTEEKYYRDLAVERLLHEAGSDQALTKLLAAICGDLIEQERDWRPDKPLRELSQQLSKEQALKRLAEMREITSEQFIAVRAQLRQRTTAFRNQLRKLGREAMDAIQREGLAVSDLASGKGGVAGLIRKLADFDDWIDENKNALKNRDKDEWHSAKASPEARASVERIAPILRQVVDTVHDLHTNGELKDHLIATAVQRDLLSSAALHLLDAQLELIKREEGLAFFSDLTRRVAAIVQNEPAPFLYERLGEKYHHFLIDEFQDTSMLQWHALLPLLTNALSSGGSALLVGDAKQAIYRWRNGEAQQFVQLPALFGRELMSAGEEHEAILARNHAPKEPLEHNRRSAEVIVNFNNTLFDGLRNTLPEQHRRVYDAQHQKHWRTMQGLVHLRCYTGEKPQEEEETPEAPAFAVFAALEAKSDGFRAGDMAVLVRTKGQGRSVASALLDAGFDVVSPDGLTLGGDATVRTIVALLNWLCRPNAAHATVASQLLAMRLGGELPVDPFAEQHPSDQLKAWARQHPTLNRRKPLLALTHAIADAIGADPAVDAFTMGLLNEVHLFVRDHGDAPLAFLDHWDRAASERSVGGTANEHAVRVMTVHASKGLQFPVVIVPWAGMSTKAKRDLLWINAHGVADPLPAALVRPTKPLNLVALPELSEENDLAALDLMDLLYVAFTRPEIRLYAGVNGKATSGLDAAMTQQLELTPGTDQVIGKRERASAPKQERAEEAWSLTPSMGHERTKPVLRLEAPEDWDPANPDPHRSLGRAMHAVLARIHIPDDLSKAVADEAPRWGLGPVEQEDLRVRLGNILDLPAVRPFFAPGLRVQAEADLIDANGQLHRPDRIVSDGSAMRVLDFKNGLHQPEHEQQVRTYAGLLRTIGHAHVTAHLLYLRDGILIDVTT